jgi:hypothetical protein
MTENSTHNSQPETDIFSELSPGSKPLPAEYIAESDRIIAEYRASQRWYRVEHRVSGFDAGLFAATCPEGAIAVMMDDSCCDDEPSPDWIATEVELVQMIQARPYEDQGLVEYAGFPEELDEWIWSVRDDYHVALVSTRVQGWGDATAIVRLERDGDPALYYLVNPAALKALGLEA